MIDSAIKGLALASFTLCMAFPAQAQGVWRCGNAYSTTPCPGGRAVEVADVRSDAELQAARETAQREARALERLLAERRAREAEALATTVYYGTRREVVKTAPRAKIVPALSPRSVSVNPPKLPKAQQSPKAAPTQTDQARKAKPAKQPPPADARTFPAAAAASRAAMG